MLMGSWARPLRTGGASLAVVLAAFPGRVQADTIVILGEGEAVAAELRAAGSMVVGPAEARSRLARLAPAPDLAPARALASEGRAAYTATTFAVAIEKLRASVAAAFAAGVPEGSAPELAGTLLDLGIAELAEGRDRDARRDATLALRLAPDLEVDRTVHGPPIRRFVDGLRSATAGARTRTIRIVSEPAGATIAIDGVERGPSPLEAPLGDGPHLVVASRPDRRTLVQRLEVGPAAGTTMTLTLAEAEPAARALVSLADNDLEAAARLAREALGAEVVIAVNGTRAARADAGGVRTLTAPTADALARAVRGGGAEPREPASHAHLAPARAAPRPDPLAEVPPRQTARASRSGGVPAWVWIGGAVFLAAAATSVAIVATSSTDRVLVPRLE